MASRNKPRSSVPRVATLLCVALACSTMAMGLTGCKGEDTKTSTDGGSTPTGGGGSSNPPPDTGSTNTPPTISGTPGTVAKTSLAYSFQPSASDSDGDSLTFSISGKPSWANFDSSTGALSGTPPDGSNGVYSGIQISVSDGTVSTSLSTFDITVTSPTIGSATLSWNAPDTNVDGTPLTDLAGYVIRYGQTQGAPSQTVSINSPGITTAVIDNLVEGTWYFSMSSVNSSGVESQPTGEVSKTIS